MSKKRLALALLCVAQFMVVLDFSIVNVAMPTIKTALKFSQSDLQWIVNAYGLTAGGLLLLAGRAADLYGRRRMLVVGLILFAAASLIGGVAGSEWLLVASRALQGIGAAIIAPASLSLLTTTFAEGEERNHALGVWGAVASGGFAAGVLLGGLLTQWLGWRSVFFVNVPIGLLAALMAQKVLPESHDEKRPQLDVWGALLVTSGVSTLVYALAAAPEAGWLAMRTLGCFAASIVLLGAFIWVESRAAAPLIPLAIFRRRTLVGANLVGALTSAAAGSTIFVLTLYYQQVLHYRAITTGLAFLPLGLVSIVASQFAARLPQTLGVRKTLVSGAFLMLAGSLWQARLPLRPVFWRDLLPAQALFAAGLSLLFVAAVIAATSGVRNEQQGLASGLLNTTEQIGGAVGLAVLVAVSTARTASVSGKIAPGTLPPASALTAGFALALYLAAGFAVAAIVATLLLIREEDCAPAPPASKTASGSAIVSGPETPETKAEPEPAARA